MFKSTYFKTSHFVFFANKLCAAVVFSVFGKLIFYKCHSFNLEYNFLTILAFTFGICCLPWFYCFQKINKSAAFLCHTKELLHLDA